MARRKSPSTETEADKANDEVTEADAATEETNGEDKGESEVTEASADTETATDTPEDQSETDSAAADATDAGEPSESGDLTGSAEAEGSTETDAAADEASASDADSAPVAATPHTLEHPERVSSGPGFVPLAFGGLVAGAIGFAGGYFFDLNAGNEVADLTGSVESQRAEIAALSEQAAAIEASVASLPPPEVDLSGIEGAIGDLGGRLDGIGATVSDLETRLTAVEARPVFTGEAGADEAAIAGAIEQLRSDLIAQQEENAGLAADIQAMAEEAANRIAEAEARAEASANTATAQAAISELRIAIASGSPFAAPLATVAEAQGLDIPEAIASVAETGVPTLAEIEAAFPAVARAALPAALQANAGDTAGDRLNAFLRSQVGGRALEPQPGDDPDAILSRAGAAVGSGDLITALDELTALPEPALEVMSDWVAQAASRIAALEALDGLAGALGN